MNYSLPKLCEQDSLSCGDELTINVLANCESIRVNTPSNRSTYLSINESIVKTIVEEIGTYEIIVKTKTKK